MDISLAPNAPGPSTTTLRAKPRRSRAHRNRRHTHPPPHEHDAFTSALSAPSTKLGATLEHVAGPYPSPPPTTSAGKRPVPLPASPPDSEHESCDQLDTVMEQDEPAPESLQWPPSPPLTQPRPSVSLPDLDGHCSQSLSLLTSPLPSEAADDTLLSPLSPAWSPPTELTSDEQPRSSSLFDSHGAWNHSGSSSSDAPIPHAHPALYLDVPHEIGPGPRSHWSPDSPEQSQEADDEPELEPSLEEAMLRSPLFYPQSWLPDASDMDTSPDEPRLSPSRSEKSSLSSTWDLHTPTDSEFFASPRESLFDEPEKMWEPQRACGSRDFFATFEDEAPASPSRGFSTLLEDDDDTPGASSDTSPFFMPPASPAGRGFLALCEDDLDGTPSTVSPASPARRTLAYLPELEIEPDGRADTPFVPPDSPRTRGLALAEDDLFPAPAQFQSGARCLHMQTPSPPPPDLPSLLFPGAPGPSSPPPDDALLRELGLLEPAPEDDMELAALVRLRTGALASERAERKVEAQLAERQARLGADILAPKPAWAVWDALEARRELQAVMTLRAETKRRRKREKERAREVGALLSLRIKERRAREREGEGPENSPILGGFGSVKGPTTSVAQLAAKMLFRRREAGARPLANRKCAIGPEERVPSALSRELDDDLDMDVD